MKVRGLILALAAIMAAHGVAFAESCQAPSEVSLPEDLSNVSRTELASIFRQMKAYQAQVGNYRQCLEDNEVSIGRRETTDLFNASVDEEEVLVTKFNRLYAAFKARNAR